MNHFDSIDLNQLRVLSALLTTRSVTQTTQQLGMSQPAVSRSLAILRQVFADPLLIRTKAGMTLTSRAEELRISLDQWQAATRSLLRSTGDGVRGLAPSGPIRVASTDFGVLSVIEPAMPYLLRQSPGLLVDICLLDRENLDQLGSGAVDVVVSGYDPEPARMYERHLFRESLCCVFGKRHPLAAGAPDQPLTLDEILAWPHIMLTVHAIDVDPLAPHLRNSGLHRRIAARLPYMVAAPLMLQETDAILISPARAFQRLAHRFELVSRPVSVDLGHFDYWLFWHERSRRDPAIMWFVDALGQHFSQPENG